MFQPSAACFEAFQCRSLTIACGCLPGYWIVIFAQTPAEGFDVLADHGDDIFAGLQVRQEIVTLGLLPAVDLGELADLLAVDEERELVVHGENQPWPSLGFSPAGTVTRQRK